MILEHDLLINHRTRELFAGLPRTKRIVDVGCGIRPCPAFQCDEHICIEPHSEYVAHLSEWKPADRAVTIIEAEAEAVAALPRKDTTVFLLDVIEHMEKDRGERLRDLLKEFEHAVIFTPLGWYEQDDTNPDGWGLNGGYWQKHRSAWEAADFATGWDVKVWERWHPKGPGAILAIR